MAKDFEKFQEFLVALFLFIAKTSVEKVTGALSDTNYYIIMCGVWLTLITFIWLVLWLTFKIMGWF